MSLAVEALHLAQRLGNTALEEKGLKNVLLRIKLVPNDIVAKDFLAEYRGRMERGEIKDLSVKNRN